MAGIRSFLASLLLVFAALEEGNAVTIQAIIDLDNDSEDLVKTLISKVDAIIDPKVIDSKNATQELAFALLRLGPLITVNGNITDGTQGFTVSFSFNAKADVNGLAQHAVQSSVEKEEDLDGIVKTRGGVLQPIAKYLEPYLLGATAIVFNGIVSNIIAHFMNELSLLSNTNMC